MAKKIAVVKFDDYGRGYHFFNDIEDLKINEQVVVDTVNGLAIGSVVDFSDASNMANKWIVQRIDLTAHKARLEREKKLKELKAKMEARRKKLEQREIYLLLAKEDEEMAKLLKEYDALQA